MPDVGTQDLEDLLDAFERQFAQRSVSLDEFPEFLPQPGDPRRLSHLVELLRIALERQWVSGSTAAIERFRAPFPELFANPSLLGPLAFEEFRLRIQDGQSVTADEYAQRYGLDVRRWPLLRPVGAARGGDSHSADAAGGAGELSRRWETFASRAPETAQRWQAAAAQQPEVGQTFDDFRLIAELGRGAFARVFLARQASLAERLVALKLTAGPTGEPAQLAQLQHTNIVPIYSVHRQAGLTAVCMPYLGSSTLADVIRGAWPQSAGVPGTPRSGQAIVSTLVARQAELPTWRADDAPAPPPGPQERNSPRLGEMGQSTFVTAATRIMAQVAEGLAHAHAHGILHRDLKPANILLGDDGQPLILDFNLAAAATPEADGLAIVGGTLPYMAPEQLAAALDGRATDHRADIFSWGVVFFELLVGNLPHALVRGSFEQMIVETQEAWRSGTLGPRAANPVVPAGIDAIIRKCLAYHADERYQSADQLVEDLRRQLADQPLRYAWEGWGRERFAKWARRHPRLVSATTVGLAAVAVSGIFAAGWYVRGEQLAVAAARQKYQDFDERLPAVRVMLAPGVRGAEPNLADEGVAAGRALLAPLEVTAAGDTSDIVARLPAEERERFVGQAAELRELLAAAEHPPGITAEPYDRRPDVFASVLVRSLHPLTERRFDEAAGLLQRHVRSEPRDAAAWLTLGYCQVSRRDLAQAELAYSMCHALAPRLHVPLYFRGLVRLEQRQFAAAYEDFSQTLEVRPTLAAAAFHRGLAAQGLARHREAIDDFTTAIDLGLPYTRVYFLRADSQRALGNREASERDRQEGLGREPADDQSWVARGLARLTSDPPGAAGDFRAALQVNPASLPALANLTHVLSERLHKSDEALECLDRWVQQFPQDPVGWGSRGVVHARSGDYERALRDAEAAVRCSRTPFVLYQVGCIHALLAPQREESRAIARGLLVQALRDQPTLARDMRGDGDLKWLRTDAEFQAALNGALALLDPAAGTARKVATP